MWDDPDDPIVEEVRKEPTLESPPISPIVRSLRGILRGSNLTEEDYRRYLEEKYR